MVRISKVIQMPVTHDHNLDVEADCLLADFRPYHSQLQMDAFITVQNGMGHPWGMYIQALREINVRRSNISTLQDELDLAEVDISEKCDAVDRRAWTRKAKLARSRASIQLSSLRRKREDLLRNQVDATRELKHFVKQGHMLREHLGTGPLTEERREELDRGWWVHRIKILVAQQCLKGGGPSVDIWEMLPGLPDDVLAQVRPYVDNPQTAVDYYKDQTSKPISLVSKKVLELTA
jgi:hypothetical protein